MGVGSTFTAISRKDLDAIQIPLPPLPTQQQIADVLDRANVLIEKRKTQIAKLDLLIKSRFIEMFGDPVLNPLGWEVKKLGDITSVGSSKRVFVEELVENGIPFYRGTEIGIMAEGDSITPSLCITQEHYNDLKNATGVPAIGDLLMPSICPDGRIWRVDTDEPFYFKDGRVLWVHLADKTVDDVYLKYALKERLIADYSNIASGTTFAELKIFALKAVWILLPPLPRQTQFADFVHKVEAQKSLLQKSLTKMEQNYKSIMQKCFRGKIF
jgi:type I restriction enzyme S subunit